MLCSNVIQTSIRKRYLEKIHLLQTYNLIGKYRKEIVYFSKKHTTQPPKSLTQQQQQQQQQRHQQKLLSPYCCTLVLLSSNFLSCSLYKSRIPVEKNKFIRKFQYQTFLLNNSQNHNYSTNSVVHRQQQTTRILLNIKSSKFSSNNCQKIKTRNMVWPTGHDGRTEEVFSVIILLPVCLFK